MACTDLLLADSGWLSNSLASKTIAFDRIEVSCLNAVRLIIASLLPKRIDLIERVVASVRIEIEVTTRTCAVRLHGWKELAFCGR